MSNQSKENVLVIPRSVFVKYLADFSAITNEDELIKNCFIEVAPNCKEFMTGLEDLSSFRNRNRTETDANFKQLVSYCLIMNPDNEIFTTVRLRTQGESRLHGMLSIGIGGHINDSDSTPDNTLMNGVLRELNEEVVLSNPYDIRLLGIVNDDSCDVGEVHAGLVFLIRVYDSDVYVRETDKMEGSFRTIEELERSSHALEDWSRICLEYLKGLI